MLVVMHSRSRMTMACASLLRCWDGARRVLRGERVLHVTRQMGAVRDDSGKHFRSQRTA